MTQKTAMEFIRHPLIPEDIWVAAQVPGAEVTLPDGRERRNTERKGGRKLVADIVFARVGGESFRIEGAENRKPEGFYNGQRIQLSIAHSRRLICGAVSRQRTIGVDIEPADRKFHPGLRGRIQHPGEAAFALGMDPLQLWTIKEAVLKWSGSGLRVPMNRVRLSRKEGEHLYTAVSENTIVEICSFIHLWHWFALAYTRPGSCES